MELVPNPTLKPNPMRSDERSSGLGSGSAAPAWNRRLVIAPDGVAESGALFSRMGWRGETKGTAVSLVRMCSVVRVHVIRIPHVWQCTQKNAFWQIPKQGISAITFRNALSTFAMLCTRLAPSSASTSRPAARRSRGRRSSRDLVVRAGDKSVKGDEVYVGQGKWNKGDAKKLPGRDGVLTGGWAGGEVGMWQFREEESRQGGKFGPWGDAESVESGDKDDGSITEVDATSSTTTGGNEATKYRLVKVLAALDRGVAASDDDRAFVGDLIDDLERAADVPRDASLEKALDGEWRLAYSSTFAGEQPGSQGFTGAPGQGAPGVSLGAVYQRLNAELKTCDNVVCLRSPLPGITGTASLGHEYVVDGRGMKISFTGVTVESSPFGSMPFKLPSPLDALPKEARDALVGAGAQSGSFETTYVDADVRVSRGDRGELRVFVR